VDHDVKYVKCGLGVPDPHLWSAETKFRDFDGGFKHRLNHRVAYPFQDFNVQMFGGHQKMLDHKNWQAFGRHLAGIWQAFGRHLAGISNINL